MWHKKFLKRLLGKVKKDWKEKYDVGRGSYGRPKILHWNEPATLQVGSFCSIADEVTILLGGGHRIDWITTYPFPAFRKTAKHILGHPQTKGDVVIGHDVWVGYGATILSGVTIGNGAVIGAQAVVTKDIPPYAIVAGNPAKFIRFRFSAEEIEILEKIQWWHWPDTALDLAMPILLSNKIEQLHEIHLEMRPGRNSREET